jgi:hypothetical protein
VRRVLSQQKGAVAGIHEAYRDPSQKRTFSRYSDLGYAAAFYSPSSSCLVGVSWATGWVFTPRKAPTHTNM